MSVKNQSPVLREESVVGSFVGFDQATVDVSGHPTTGLSGEIFQ
jgi:hypothetical protein